MLYELRVVIRFTGIFSETTTHCGTFIHEVQNMTECAAAHKTSPNAQGARVYAGQY